MYWAIVNVGSQRIFVVSGKAAFEIGVAVAGLSVTKTSQSVTEKGVAFCGSVNIMDQIGGGIEPLCLQKRQ